MSRGFTHESQHNESAEWYTPPEIFEALGLTFDLDPCSPGEGKDFVPARKRYTKQDNGLLQNWEGLVFMNPPYGMETAKWMDKLANYGNGIALVFSRTDVKWFQSNISKMSGVCFISSRTKFYQGSKDVRGGTPGAGSMLCCFGDVAAEAAKNSNLGAFLVPIIQEAPVEEKLVPTLPITF